MTAYDKYNELKHAVEAAGFFTTQHDCDRIVCASKRFEHGLTGNSFWIAERDSVWYLGTWGPFLYHIPDASRVSDLCIAWLGRTNETMADIDDALKTEYELKPADIHSFDMRPD